MMADGLGVERQGFFNGVGIRSWTMDQKTERTLTFKGRIKKQPTGVVSCKFRVIFGYYH